MAALTPTAKMQFFKADGTPLVGGKLYTYTAGTTTPQTTYTDSSGGTANTNPVILDSRGEANIWLGGATYKFKLADANDVEIWTVDNISAPTSGVSPALSGNVTIDTNSSAPALKITQTGTGYALRVQDSTDPDATSTVIDNTGKVGIGTISPSELLDVSGGNIAMTSAGGTLYAKITPGASTTDLAADGARALTFTTNSNERLRITDTGLVGIGKTPSAGVELDVVGDIAASATVSVGTTLLVDTITEKTASAGVTAAGVLLKNSLVAGSARPILSFTEQATTSGTEFLFNDIPSYVNRISVMLNGISLSGSDSLIIQLGTGTSGTPVWIASGYVSQSLQIGVTSISSTSAFNVILGNNAVTVSGLMTISKMTPSSWLSTSYGADTTPRAYIGYGILTGAGTITQIRLTRTGTNTFDAGSVNVFYE